MSWLEQNYEKAAIGGAAVAALGLAFFGWNKVSGVENDFSTTLRGAGDDASAVAGSERVTRATASLEVERAWRPADTQGRQVDLFTGIPLFVSRDNPTVAIDLLRDEPVHPPIPNTWWIENRLDPGYADALERDPDEDGFTNLEEFLAGTDPNDPRDHPPLVAKLMYQRDETLTWVLRPGFPEAGGYTFTYRDTEGNVNRATAIAPVLPDQLFFTDGAAENRFKMIGNEEREVFNPRINENETMDFVIVEDQRPNKVGVRYEIRASFPELQTEDWQQYDRTAVLSLEALGLEGNEFMVEENTRFSLPPGQAETPYLLKSVTPEQVEIEFETADGSPATLMIQRGSLPDMGR